MASASILLEQGKEKILLLDEYDRLGGNHISRNIGPYSFDIGSFIFHNDSPFFRRFPFLLQDCLPFNGTTGRLTPQGKLASYPFDVKADLLHVGPAETMRMFSSLLRGRLTKKPDNNALEFVTYWLGERLARRTGLISYLRRFYAADPSLIEGDFARKRMNWVSSNANLRGLAKKLSPPKAIDNRAFVRPQAGFPSLYDQVGAALRERGVETALGKKIESIRRQADGLLEVRACDLAAKSPMVVSTMPVTSVARWSGIEAGDRIHYSTLTSLFYSFSGTRGFPHNILYNFSDDGLWKRLTMHSDCYGRANQREYFSVEVVSTDACDNVEKFDRDFQDHVRRNGLFDGELVLEGAERTDSAYPVYLDGASASAAGTIKALRDYGILSFGRQGGFDYQPTADVSAATAEKMLGTRK